MARIGIYGGTFNPPHTGHIHAARCALDTLALDQILLIPDRIAPHKFMPPNTPTPQQRLDMIGLAAASMADSRVRVSDLELRREGPSYTWQTLEQLKREYPDDTLFLLMGTDMFLSFETWKHPERILRWATLAVFYRGEPGEAQTIAVQKARLEALDAKVELIRNPVVDISSTQLRRMLTFRCADAYLPAGVGEYIRANGLYDTAENLKALPMARLEQVVTGLLKPNRVAHVLGCRDTAVALAKTWGADETDAARAGLLHDITKALDGHLQLTLCSAYGMILSDFFQKYPKTLHALTGSLVAERIFGENPAVVAAIRSHTTGKAAMTTLEKIIYVADYMEPNRAFPGVEQLRHLAFTDLDGAMKLGLTMTVEMLRKQGSEVSPESRQALEYFEKTLEKEG